MLPPSTPIVRGQPVRGRGRACMDRQGARVVSRPERGGWTLLGPCVAQCTVRRKYARSGCGVISGWSLPQHPWLNDGLSLRSMR